MLLVSESNNKVCVCVFRGEDVRMYCVGTEEVVNLNLNGPIN